MFVVYYFCTIYIFKTRLKKLSVFSVIRWFYLVKRANIKNISVHIIRAKFVLWNVGSHNIVVPTLIGTVSEWRRVQPDGPSCAELTAAAVLLLTANWMDEIVQQIWQPVSVNYRRHAKIDHSALKNPSASVLFLFSLRDIMACESCFWV